MVDVEEVVEFRYSRTCDGCWGGGGAILIGRRGGGGGLGTPGSGDGCWGGGIPCGTGDIPCCFCCDAFVFFLGGGGGGTVGNIPCCFVVIFFLMFFIGGTGDIPCCFCCDAFVFFLVVVVVVPWGIFLVVFVVIFFLMFFLLVVPIFLVVLLWCFCFFLGGSIGVLFLILSDVCVGFSCDSFLLSYFCCGSIDDISCDACDFFLLVMVVVIGKFLVIFVHLVFLVVVVVVVVVIEKFLVIFVHLVFLVVVVSWSLWLRNFWWFLFIWYF